MSAKEHQALVKALTNKGTYVLDDVAKRCEFGPNIGFLFKAGDQSLAVLIAYNCDVIKFVKGTDCKIKEDCDPAHDKLVAIGNGLFNNAFSFY